MNMGPQGKKTHVRGETRPWETARTVWPQHLLLQVHDSLTF